MLQFERNFRNLDVGLPEVQPNWLLKVGVDHPIKSRQGPQQGGVEWVCIFGIVIDQELSV